jgi:hypothetical protein
MTKWHTKVELRVTQTFKQLNMRRIISIIGYDPSSFFRGEMSYMNMEALKKGTVPDTLKAKETADRSNYGSRRLMTKDNMASKFFKSPER